MNTYPVWKMRLEAFGIVFLALFLYGSCIAVTTLFSLH